MLDVCSQHFLLMVCHNALNNVSSPSVANFFTGLTTFTTLAHFAHLPYWAAAQRAHTRATLRAHRLARRATYRIRRVNSAHRHVWALRCRARRQQRLVVRCINGARGRVWAAALALARRARAFRRRAFRAPAAERSSPARRMNGGGGGATTRSPAPPPPATHLPTEKTDLFFSYVCILAFAHTQICYVVPQLFACHCTFLPIYIAPCPTLHLHHTSGQDRRGRGQYQD